MELAVFSLRSSSQRASYLHSFSLSLPCHSMAQLASHQYFTSENSVHTTSASAPYPPTCDPMAAAELLLSQSPAGRFKTRVCDNFGQFGQCSYEQRCTFAHGEIELRTYDTNVAAGLTTMDAVNAFQRGKRKAARRAERRRVRRHQVALTKSQARAANPGGVKSNDDSEPDDDDLSSAERASSCCAPQLSGSWLPTWVAGLHTPGSRGRGMGALPAPVTVVSGPRRPYRHDPYNAIPRPFVAVPASVPRNEVLGCGSGPVTVSTSIK
jgi:hypothetical protein